MTRQELADKLKRKALVKDLENVESKLRDNRREQSDTKYHIKELEKDLDNSKFQEIEMLVKRMRIRDAIVTLDIETP